MVKTKEEQTLKERNTQRRKRKDGWFHKAYLLKKICDFEVAAYLRNPESGQIYTFRSENGVWFPRFMEDVELACPAPEHMLPKDFEQTGKRGKPRAKPRLDSRSNKGTPHNVRNQKVAARKRKKAARYNCPLPEPPPFGLTRRGDRKGVVYDYVLDELKQSQVAFLEELGLNLF